MYLFYRLIIEQKNVHPQIIHDGMEIKKRVPHSVVPGMQHMNIGRRKCIYFQIHTFLRRGFSRSFVEYDLLKDGKIVSKAVLISKVPIYSFLPDDGVHLCYCETVSEEQGQGYYPLLLNYIQHDNPTMKLFMIVDEINYASIRGIEKAGFVRYAKGIKSDEGVFRITEYVNEKS